METTKQVIQMDIVRREGKTVFKFKVPDKVTAIYKTVASEVRESTSWKGLKFYFIPDLAENVMYQNELSRNMLVDDYGVGLIKRGHFNIAWLRTVSGEGEIVVSDSVSFADLSVLVKNCTQFVKRYFEQHYTDFKISGTITLEV